MAVHKSLTALIAAKQQTQLETAIHNEAVSFEIFSYRYFCFQSPVSEMYYISEL